jgi:hypothetical protein
MHIFSFNRFVGLPFCFLPLPDDRRWMTSTRNRDLRVKSSLPFSTVAQEMPLVVPDLALGETKAQTEREGAKKDEKPADQSKESGTVTTDKSKPSRDPRSAPGMEGMSEEAIRKFDEAMELEYQKREGGA